MKDKYKGFSNEELYMLKRQAIESSNEILTSYFYSEEQKKLHECLLNEIVEEIKEREQNE